VSFAPKLLTACGGFLFAVLWMDLMFDVQVWGHPGGPLPDGVLESIARYYRRVTTEASPMGHAVGTVMIITLATSALRLWRGAGPAWRRWTSLATAGLPIVLALAVIFPDAVELGSGAGTPAHRSDLARAIFAAHAACLVSIALFIGLQLTDRSKPPA
jgi:hypothetical protein